jgi:hypothetical protein
MCQRPGLQIQLLPSLRDIKLAQRHQCAAFIQDESYILVWDDDPERLLQHGADLEHQLVEIAWQSATGTEPKNRLAKYSEVSEKYPLLETGGTDKRHQTHINSIICACTLALSLFIVGLGMNVLAQEIALDRNYIRLAALLFTPIQFLLSLVCSSVPSYIPKYTDFNSSFSCKLSLCALSSCSGPLDSIFQTRNITQQNRQLGRRGMSYSHMLPYSALFSWRVSRPSSSLL